MIQLPAHITPDITILNRLQAYQAEIDVLLSFTEKSEKAKAIFPNRNKIGNIVFDAIKAKLTEMCSGARRCVYCEDSVADEVEHIHPKDLYPGMCFQWENYVYACGNCNGPKNNKFAIFRNDNGQFYIVNPPRNQNAVEPPAGVDAMINPRVENPLDFCMLDLLTFDFNIISTLNTDDIQKADYTFNEVLRLNRREHLREARENAYENYKSRLDRYTNCKLKDANSSKLERMKSNLKREAHPTVWREMQRQHRIGILQKQDADLDALFITSPEALLW